MLGIAWLDWYSWRSVAIVLVFVCCLPGVVVWLFGCRFTFWCLVSVGCYAARSAVLWAGLLCWVG